MSPTAVAAAEGETGEDTGHGRVLSARLDNVRLLADALSCIYSSARKAQDVVLSVPAAGGLKFGVEQTGCLLASVLLPLNSFASFTCADYEAAHLRMNLSLLLDCLGIFASGGGGAASPGVGTGGGMGLTGPAASSGSTAPVGVRIAYDGTGHPLVLVFHEAEARTVCRLGTIDDDHGELGYGRGAAEHDFRFLDHPVHNMALLQSEPLRDAIAELDYMGATTAELRLAPTRPRFRFRSPASSSVQVAHLRDEDDGLGQERGRTGPGGLLRDKANRDGDNGEDAAVRDEDGEYETGGGALCSVELPDPEDRGSSVFSEFRSSRPQVSCYRLELLQRCSKALALSQTCKVQMNELGMLSLVCRMRPGMATASMAGERRASMSAGEHLFTEFIIVAEEIDLDDDDDESSGADEGEMDEKDG